MKSTKAAVEMHKERHANNPETVLIGQKTLMGGGGKAKAGTSRTKAGAKKSVKDERAVSPEEKPAGNLFKSPPPATQSFNRQQSKVRLLRHSHVC